jgi:hypothetical protein
LGSSSITGVGGKQAKIAGRGTIKLISTCNSQEYVLILQNVLHVPGTQNNLILLGRWDAAGGQYTGGGGVITLITSDERQVARGNKINNHLYRMRMSIRKPTSNSSNPPTSTDPQTFVRSELALGWEMWH